MGRHYYTIQDFYQFLKYPQKFTGNRPITTRSSWEAKFIQKYLDINTNIVEWKSEDIVIQYFCPTDKKMHRYFCDFWFKAKTKDGTYKEFLVEVKPEKELSEPKPPTRKTASYYNNVATYIKNQAKWSAAKQLCEKRRQSGVDIEFMILTEKDCPWFLSK
jgi:hypothetical protein